MRHTPKLYSDEGLTDTVRGWSVRLGISRQLLYQHLRTGKSLRDIRMRTVYCCRCGAPIPFRFRYCTPCYTLRHHECYGSARALPDDVDYFPGPNQIAHCGMWHPITTLPQRLLCCGYVLGEVA